MSESLSGSMSTNMYQYYFQSNKWIFDRAIIIYAEYAYLLMTNNTDQKFFVCILSICVGFQNCIIDFFAIMYWYM